MHTRTYTTVLSLAEWSKLLKLQLQNQKCCFVNSSAWSHSPALRLELIILRRDLQQNMLNCKLFCCDSLVA